MVTALRGAPAGTTAIRFDIAGTTHELPVGTSHAGDFAGTRLVFTMSKDNDLAWIREWASWHNRIQGADSVVFFDNGSSRYSTGEIEETLLSTGGLKHVCVLDWRGRYGQTDPALRINPFYILFLQVSAMSVALRRFASGAFGLMNCDIDELISSPAGTSAFELAQASRHGLLVMRGRFMEPVAGAGNGGRRPPRRCRRCSRVWRRPRRGRKRGGRDRPGRGVKKTRSVPPYMPGAENRRWLGRERAEGLSSRHFRAINTGWKDNRAEIADIDPAALVKDATFANLVHRHVF